MALRCITALTKRYIFNELLTENDTIYIFYLKRNLISN